MESRKQQADKFFSRAIDAVQDTGDYRFKADIYKNGKAEPEEVRANDGHGNLTDHGFIRLRKMRDYLDSAANSPDGGFFLSRVTGKYEAKQDTEAALKLTPSGRRFPDVVGYKASLEHGIQEDGKTPKPSYKGYAEWKNSQMGMRQLDPDDKAMEKAYDSHEAFTSFDPNSMGKDEPVRKVEGRLVFNPAFAENPQRITTALQTMPELSNSERILGMAQLKKEVAAPTVINEKLSKDIFDFISKDNRSSQNALKSVSDKGNADRMVEKGIDFIGQTVGNVLGNTTERGSLDGVLKNGNLLRERDKTISLLNNAKNKASSQSKRPNTGHVSITEPIEARLKVMNDLVEKFNRYGITDGKVMGETIQDAAKEHVWANGTEDKVRTLSDGRIALKKEAVAERDPNTILRLIESQKDASPYTINRAKETYLQNRDSFATDLSNKMLTKDKKYRAYVNASSETNPAKLISDWNISNARRHKDSYNSLLIVAVVMVFIAILLKTRFLTITHKKMTTAFNRLLKWFGSLSKKQRWVLFAGFALIVIFTLIHNPLSGYHKEYNQTTTRQPLGIGSDSDYGYLSLGLPGTYFTFIIGTILITIAAIYQTGSEKV